MPHTTGPGTEPMSRNTANLYSLAADAADWLASRLSGLAGWLRGKAVQS